jgi:hypothetical protein
MIFNLKEDEVPNHDRASSQEGEESIYNNDIPCADSRPTRTISNATILTVAFNSQDRK